MSSPLVTAPRSGGRRHLPAMPGSPTDAVGPILGGRLTQWTWRAIFWVNIPVAVVALVLIAMARPHTQNRPAPMDHRGLALIVAGVGLSSFPFQQSYLWGRHSAATWLCIVVGLLLLVLFVLVERRTTPPLLDVELFRDRAFSVQNVVLGVAMAAFVPVFCFTSVYAETGLGNKGSEAGLDLLYFFLGFFLSTPTRSTGHPNSPAARRPESPRPYATTAPAGAWPSSARSSPRCSGHGAPSP
ncbi:hypothetical protein ACGFY9_27840 [Streptomyces sp. NPDC048504]|uniref:hypothetical protein n=1 Tax=Streptomyces sp. NPDC048504 TaxID=3365559 RepID=UPI0037124BCD